MLSLALGFLNDVIVVGGTAMLTAMMATGTAEMPRPAVILVSLLMGLVQAGRRLDSKLAPSPLPPKPVTAAVRTPAQLDAQVKMNEATIAQIAAAVVRSLPTVPPKEG